jgi:hypothetical protein
MTSDQKPQAPEYSPPVQSRDGRVVLVDFFKAMQLAAMGQPKGKKR